MMNYMTGVIFIYFFFFFHKLAEKLKGRECDMILEVHFIHILLKKKKLSAQIKKKLSAHQTICLVAQIYLS